MPATPNHALQRTAPAVTLAAPPPSPAQPSRQPPPSLSLGSFGYVARLVNNQTKAAYRHLLYVAMIATRNYCQPRACVSRNPFVWRRQYHDSRVAGMLADWLHNLALYSSLDFDGFEEEHFWHEHTLICQHYPAIGFERYREIFDEYFTGKRNVC